ncbi:peptide chain release factor 2 [Thermophilibacter immobilis]|jgi:peptide chain release factor 2|uniref:Peptide chain release factor 2 n=1 Tax=Thermophilibacter immobilis TaxID=2779519 RepID=A0A7S7M8R4_9ACTN|nr:peptide chain release factor 2 [Thermophilibacter immobilis]QOY60779.1 peptide chain release factor 2 [Thermophilibacter immobilis]
MADVAKATLDALAQRLDEVEGYLHLDARRGEIADLEKRGAAAGFWDDADAARATMARLSSARDDVSGMESARAKLGDARAAFELGEEMDDEDLLGEAAELCASLEHDLSELELSSWFSGDFDHGDAIVTVTPGQGGLEAQDWCEMLFHMYLRYCDRRGWKVTVNDAPVAEVIGLDRATFTVSGKNAYGMLRAEQGVHRLVRISPTDDKKRRQTTFAGVEVLPVVPEDVEVDIDPSDLRIDVYHASGPGGQGVNTTDSAVRITHLPTNTVVTCQNERSQLQNKAAALQILRSRLYELEMARREAELDELRGPKRAIGFGNQIRSYVLYPYQLVKDLRTGVETGNVESVLSDGDLDKFIVGYHRWAAGGGESSS